MKLFIGKLFFYVTIPLLALYMPFKPRSRVLVKSQGKLLVVRSWYGTGKWSTPGGGINRGESPLQSAKRELYEETGLDYPLSLFSYCYSKTETYSTVVRTTYHMFALEIPEPLKTSTTSHEQIESKWVSEDSIVASGMYSNDLIDALKFVNSRQLSK